MAYCSALDVQNEFKALVFGPTTTPTDTQVNEFCIEESSKIDAKLSGRWFTPITGTISLALLKPLAIAFVAARVAAILKVKTGDGKIDQGPQTFLPIKDATAMLENIYIGLWQLPDATLISSADGVRSWATDVASDDVSIVPNFNRNVSQW